MIAKTVINKLKIIKIHFLLKWDQNLSDAHNHPLIPRQEMKMGLFNYKKSWCHHQKSEFNCEKEGDIIW